MKHKFVRAILVIVLLATLAGLGNFNPRPAAAQGTADLYIKDTPLDTGVEPNPDLGPMYVTEDIWVRTEADPNYQPKPFPEASPTWSPLLHQNPEYRDPKLSRPNYVYVRVRNRGNSVSTGTEELHLYWAKASTGLSWDTQWVDYLVSSGSSNTLYGAEITKERKNAATATQAERDAYVQAILNVGTIPGLVFPGGRSYWHKQDEAHEFGPAHRHGTPAFLPWHREMINQYEILLQEADPTVKLLYWDWTTNPENSTNGFNFFTPAFMGTSGRGGTAPASIGPPFNPPTGLSLAPPSVTRWLAFNPQLQLRSPTTVSDATVLSNTYYYDDPSPSSNPGFGFILESSPHNHSHVYIGGCNNTLCNNLRGNMSRIQTAAEDPFFFLLHANVDRLWAQWQRDPAELERLDTDTAYDSTQDNANINLVERDSLNNPIIDPATGKTIPIGMRPWNGRGTAIRPWTTADGYITIKMPTDASVVSPPIYDTAPLVIPVLQPGEAVVIEIPWYPPNPAKFGSFADPGHVCLLARIETANSPPFGMTTPEGTNVDVNTRNNNNIAWKNVTIAGTFPGALRLTSALIRNVFEEPVFTGLRFAEPQESGASFFDFGFIRVDLGSELFSRWVEGGSVGQAIEPVGGSIIQIFSPEASIQNIKLEPGEVFPVEIYFELFDDYDHIQGEFPKWDILQTGTPEDPEAIVGGQRFEIDFSKIVLVKTGDDWSYLDDGSTPDESWASLDFDDSDWKMGKAALGFGNNIVTTIDGGPPDNRHITTYFRNKFEVDDPSFFRTLYLRLRRNDGAVVYLNGTEIHRVNLPEGEIAPDTPATRDVGGLEREVFFPIQVDRELVNPGSNIVAVEIHLASPTSLDLSFDLELLANLMDPRFLPDASFATPTNGALFQVDQGIPIEVEALDSDGVITEVSVLADGELLGIDTDPPYTFQWEGAPLGTHLLRAVALDNDQQQAVIDMTISVLENTSPSVNLTQPVEDNVFHLGEVIPVSADASDEGGNISRVEFYLIKMGMFGSPEMLVGTAETAPYETSLTVSIPGHYMLYALAVDDGGLVSQSLPLEFEVHGMVLFLPLVGRQ